MLVRVGLKNSVDWSKFNMEVIADVANGLAGLSVYQKERPDFRNGINEVILKRKFHQNQPPSQFRRKL